MGNCSSIDENIAKLPLQKEVTESPPSPVPLSDIITLISKIDGKFYYYIKGVDIKKIQCPYTGWIGVTTFGYTLGCLEEEEPYAFAIICFNQLILNTGANFFASYLGHCTCTYHLELKLEQNMAFNGVPVKTISKQIRNLPNVYCDYLDTKINNKSNGINGVGSDIINILQNKILHTHKFIGKVYHYIHLNSLPKAYTFYIKNKFENIAIDYNSSTQSLVQYPALWDSRTSSIIYYFNVNDFMKDVIMEGVMGGKSTTQISDHSLNDLNKYCQHEIANRYNFLGQEQDGTHFSLIGCICFLDLSKISRSDIFSHVTTPTQGGTVKEKILYKGYYFTVRRDRYGKYIYSPRIGRVSFGKARRSS